MSFDREESAKLWRQQLPEALDHEIQAKVNQAHKWHLEKRDKKALEHETQATHTASVRTWLERIFWMLVLIAVLILLTPHLHAQGQVTVHGIAKGTTVPNTATVEAPDANHNGLDVVCVSGCGGGSGGTASNFAAAFPTQGTAIGVKNGANMVNLTADGSNNLNVNCAVGCAGGSSTPADTFTNPTTAGLQMTFPMLWNGTTWDRLYGDKTNGAWVNIKTSATIPVSGTFWQATQPVSGTVTATQTTGTNLHIVCDSGCSSSTSPTFGTTFPSVGTPVGGTDGTNFQALQLDTNKYLKVSVQNASIPVTGTFWQSTQPVSLASLPALAAGSATIGSVKVTDGTNTGAVKAASTAALAADPALVVAISPNNSVAVTGTFWQATQPVSIAANVATTDAATSSTGSAIPAKAASIGGTDGTNLVSFYVDPCQRGAHSSVNISLTANTQLITGTASKKTFICALNIVSAAADNVALVEGTGTVCATGIAGMAGGTTAATGWNFAANGGMTLGNGAATVLNSAVAADNVCLLVSGATQVSGSIQYVTY